MAIVDRSPPRTNGIVHDFPPKGQTTVSAPGVVRRAENLTISAMSLRGGTEGNASLDAPAGDSHEEKDLRGSDRRSPCASRRICTGAAVRGKNFGRAGNEDRPGANPR